MKAIELTSKQLNVIFDSLSKDGVVAYELGDNVFVGYGFNPSDINTKKFEKNDFYQWLKEIDFENETTGSIH